MEIRIKKTPVRNIYQDMVKAIPNDTEKPKLARFGDPIVEVGGSFDGFTLPAQEKKIPSEFPYTEKFDADELGRTEAERRANNWASVMYTRIHNAITQFKAIPDTFEGETVYTV